MLRAPVDIAYLGISRGADRYPVFIRQQNGMPRLALTVEPQKRTFARIKMPGFIGGTAHHEIARSDPAEHHLGFFVCIRPPAGGDVRKIFHRIILAVRDVDYHILAGNSGLAAGEREFEPHRRRIKIAVVASVRIPSQAVGSGSFIVQLVIKRIRLVFDGPPRRFDRKIEIVRSPFVAAEDVFDDHPVVPRPVLRHFDNIGRTHRKSGDRR